MHEYAALAGYQGERMNYHLKSTGYPVKPQSSALEWKVQKMTILGQKKTKNWRLRDFHKSEKVTILGEKKKKKYPEWKVQRMTIFGQKKTTGGCVIFTKVKN